MEEKNSMCSNWQGDKEIESDKDNIHEKIAVISLKQMKDFKNHPFKVELKTELFELMQSFEKEGVLVQLLARRILRENIKPSEKALWMRSHINCYYIY